MDINPRDYRAWYGLGQTYELLQMYLYAIYYYRKAATLRPFDARMWCALVSARESSMLGGWWLLMRLGGLLRTFLSFASAFPFHVLLTILQIPGCSGT